MTDVSVDLSGEMTVPPITGQTGATGFQKIMLSVPTMKDFVTTCKQSIRPWGQFTNTSNFKTPPNAARLLKRAVNNVKYFQGNYVIISIVLMAYCLLTSPFLLLSVLATLVTCYMLSLRNAEKKLVIQGKEISLQQQYMLVALASTPLYYWAGVGEAMFWVIGASCFVISIHAGLYNIEEVISEQDQLELLIQQV